MPSWWWRMTLSCQRSSQPHSMMSSRSISIVETASEALTLLRAGGIRLMLLDCTLPGGVEVDLIPEADRSRTPVVVLMFRRSWPDGKTDRPATPVRVEAVHIVRFARYGSRRSRFDSGVTALRRATFWNGGDSKWLICCLSYRESEQSFRSYRRQVEFCL